MRLRIVLPIVCAMASADADAQERNLAALADTVFTRWNSTHTPGCAVGIGRDGRVLLARGYGMADLESGTPVTAETIFESGSVAKQFTATAIMLLVMDGKLRLDDEVQKYVPELPRYDRPITIRHLLTHTSGLREWSSLVGLTGWPRGSRAHTQHDLLDIVFRQRALNYPVGDHYSYTNSGYALAMTIVERVSGRSFEQFSQERIFRPLGLSKTRWRDDFTRVIPGRAQAYTPGPDGWHIEMPFESVVGPGGMLTTVGDWLRWNDALAKHTLARGLIDSLLQPMRLTSGRVIPYALGIVRNDYRGVREISHSGSTAGYSTYLARYPDHGNLSIAVLCNSTSGSAGSYVHQIADRLLSFPVAAAPDTSAARPNMLAPYAGVYRNDRFFSAVTILASDTTMRPMAGGWFWRPNGTRVRFESRPDGTPSRMLVTQTDGDTVSFTWVAREPWRPSQSELAAFAGTYFSDEIGTRFTVRQQGDSLLASNRAGVTIRLRPVYRDAFIASGGSTVWFTRDRSGRVDAMHLSQSRLWNLVLPRVATASR